MVQLEHVLASAPFRTSEIHRTLLSYLVERSLAGAGDSLKEYTVGLEVFRKPESYDPRQESTVRMHVARLRQKLAEYYQTEGASDSLVIGLPKGGFKIAFTSKPEPAQPEIIKPEPATVVEPIAKDVSDSRKKWIGVGAVLAMLGIAPFVIAHFWNHPSATPAKAQLTDVDKLWDPMLTPNRHLIICLSDNSSAPGVSAAGTADGAFLLGQFLATRKKDVSLEKSSQLSMSELAMDNIVFLGPVASNRRLQMLVSNLDFTMDAKGVHNVRPRPGEPVVFADRLDEGSIEETYGLVTHIPGLNGEGDTLFLSGNQASSVAGLVRSFTDRAWARALTARIAAGGRLPRFYQTVVKVRSMDGMPMDAVYVMHRELMH